MNPWNLNAQEEQALRLLIEHGSQKVVALTAGLSNSRVSNILTKATKKMEEKTHIKALLAFDRWERSK